MENGVKIRVTPEESLNIQKRLFEEDFKWGNGSRETQYVRKPFLFLYYEDPGVKPGTGYLRVILYQDDPEHFEQSPVREVEDIQQILQWVDTLPPIN